MLKSSAFVDLT